MDTASWFVTLALGLDFTHIHKKQQLIQWLAFSLSPSLPVGCSHLQECLVDLSSETLRDHNVLNTSGVKMRALSIIQPS